MILFRVEMCVFLLAGGQVPAPTTQEGQVPAPTTKGTFPDIAKPVRHLCLEIPREIVFTCPLPDFFTPHQLYDDTPAVQPSRH
jgi:hypothetical protein